MDWPGVTVSRLVPSLLISSSRPGLGGRGQAEHGDDGPDADGDAERGQGGSEPPGAQADAGQAGQVADPEPPAGHGGGGHGCGSTRRDGRVGPGVGHASIRLARGFSGSRFGGVGDDVAVEHLDPPGHAGGDGLVVGDDHDGRALLVQVVEEGQDGGAGGLVQVAGGFVGQHDGRLADQGPGDRHALALAARELGGAGAGPASQPDDLQGVQGGSAALGGTDPGVEEPVGHVLGDGGVLGQEELLEHEPDPGGPQRGQVAVAHLGHVEAGEAHDAGGRPVQGAHEVEQGGLARP